MGREIWVADCETDPFKKGRIPQPFIWGCYNGSEYHEFDNTDDFIDFITEIDCIVYAHNGGKFDWHYCFYRLEPYEPLMVINGRMSRFQIGEAEFRDSFNILPVALKQFQKDEFDYSLLEPDVRDKPENRKKIQKYLKSDCTNLYAMVTQFIDEYGLNLTLASSALKMWQKITGMKPPRTTSEFYDDFSPYYYGGRVECFESGIINHDFKVIDINSAYPYAMKHLHAYGDNYHVSDELPNSRAYTERCFIRVSCISRGAFPFRTENGLSFPNDNTVREYYVTGWEWLAALETKSIINWEIIEVTSFNESIRFDEYIDHFYALKNNAKEKGDKAAYLFAKLFLNSLYGKFGANPDNYDEYTIVEPQHIEAAESDGYGFCAELNRFALVSRPLPEEKMRYFNIAVAASITGFVRAYLWRAIKECKGVMYCDTDSIACTDTGNLELDPSTLGAWDIEAECDKGGIAGKKLYAFHKKDGGWKTASKGVKFDHNQIMRVAEGEEITFEPENPSYSIKRGIQFVPRKVVKNV